MTHNAIPRADADFPAPWPELFRVEVFRSAASRIDTMSKALLVLEILLLVFDFFRLRNTPQADSLVVWRISLVSFLICYVLFAQHIAIEARVRLFAFAAMVFASWVSAILGTLSGDMAVYTTGVLAIAALCPLPGWFNATAFIVSGLALATYLFTLGDPRVKFWIVNIVGSCFLATIIEQICFRASLREFRERQRADTLLYNVFPSSVATLLKDGRRSVEQHSEVTILFGDLVGFTRLASQLVPSQLVDMLEDLFGRFDRAAREHGVEKIKTIGDAYMAVCGAPVAIDRPAERMAAFALEMVDICRRFSDEKGFDLAMRVGIHTGPVVAGVIGHSRLCYDLWGDSVNMAQRLEAHSEHNLITVSEPVYHQLRARFHLEDRGILELKGKGPTRTFALVGAGAPVAAD